MDVEEISKNLGLEQDRHFQIQKMKVPVIESELYTSLGKELYDLYRKYEISRDDQRQIERLSFALMTFTLSRKSKSH